MIFLRINNEEKLLRFIAYKIILSLYYTSIRAMSLRERCYKYILKKSGEGLNIADGVTINDPSNVSDGKRVSIHPNCWIQGYGSVVIGDFVGIASGTKIISSIHDFSLIDTPIKKQGSIKQPVVIGNECGLVQMLLYTGRLSGMVQLYLQVFSIRRN